jgi:predicted transcriptional regulator
MHNRNPEISALTLRLDKAVIAEIDAVAGAMRMCRTTWIRRAIRRNMAYSKEHELPLLQGADIQAVLMP